MSKKKKKSNSNSRKKSVNEIVKNNARLKAEKNATVDTVKEEKELIQDLIVEDIDTTTETEIVEVAEIVEETIKEEAKVEKVSSSSKPAEKVKPKAKKVSTGKKFKKIDTKKIIVWVLIVALLLTTFASVFASIIYEIKYGGEVNVNDVYHSDLVNEYEDGALIQDETGAIYQVYEENGEKHMHKVANSMEEYEAQLAETLGLSENVDVTLAPELANGTEEDHTGHDHE